MNKTVKTYIVYVILLIVIVTLMFIGGFTYLCAADTNSGQNITVIKEELVQKNNDTLEIVIYEKDIELIAKTVYGEARGCSIAEQSAVIWCILNRVDAGYGTIEAVITAPYQFTGYKESNPVIGDYVELATDVLLRWQIEKYCIGDVGRTLPDNYLYFHGDGKQNHFRDKYDGDYNIWEWQALNPYP